MHHFSTTAGALVVCMIAACASRTSPTAPPPGTGSSAPVQARLTPQNLEALMEKIGPGYESLRKHLQANATAEAAKDAQQLAEWFGAVEKFWAQHNREDAVKRAGMARTYAAEAAGAAAAGNAVKAAAAADNLNTACERCHGTYRVSDGKGAYTIKPGIIGR